MVLVAEDEVKVESALYNELKRDLGKNFKLFAETVSLKEWKKKGPYVPPEADMGSKRNALSFPPLISRWSLRQTKEVVKDTGKVIKINEFTREELMQTLGEKRTNTIKDNIGMEDRPLRGEEADEKDVNVFYTAWGKGAYWPKYELNGTWLTKPVFKPCLEGGDEETAPPGGGASSPSKTKKSTVKLKSKNLGAIEDGAKSMGTLSTGEQMPHPTKTKGKFYWPHMTNAVAKIPASIPMNTKVRDLESWIKFYGEPNPDKIPTGTMTTFEPVSKIVAGGKSSGKNAVTKVDGRTWKREFDVARGIAQKP